jgi:hypothetical protein
VKRKDTHLRFDPLDLDFSGLTDFEAGWKFHLYSDMRRDEILNAYNFYSLPYTEEFAGQAAKMLEDELVYDDFENWSKIIHCFNNPPIIENGIGVDRETFELWYAINAKYLERRPDNQSFRIFFSKQPSLVDKAEKIIKIIDKLRKNGKVIELLKKVKEEIV